MEYYGGIKLFYNRTAADKPAEIDLVPAPDVIIYQ